MGGVVTLLVSRKDAKKRRRKELPASCISFLREIFASLPRWRLCVKILLLLSFPLLSAAQKVVETHYDYKWTKTTAEDASFFGVNTKTDSGWFMQVEYIHSNSYYLQGLYQDADGVIPNGFVAWHYSNGHLKSIGKYVEGKKVGLWLSYYANDTPQDSIIYIDGQRQVAKSWFPNGVLKDSMVLDEDGNGDFISWYDNGRLSSTGRVARFDKHADQWKYYHKNGTLAANLAYKHRTDKIIDSRYFNESGKETKAEKDRDAVFPGGATAWSLYLEKNVVIPQGFHLEGGRKATVVIHAFINTEGKVTGAYVKVPLHPTFDEAVLKAVNNSPSWIPAIHHNRKVYDEIDVPFTFIQRSQIK
jgi:hypothetical protein